MQSVIGCDSSLALDSLLKKWKREGWRGREGKEKKKGRVTGLQMDQ